MTELITQDRKLARQQAAEIMGCQVDAVFDLLRRQWPQKGEQQFSDMELFQAVHLIGHYRLDPMTREVYCSRDSRGRILVVVGIDGWIKVLHRLPGYDGHEQTVEFDEAGNPVSCTTTIYSTEKSHPVKYTGYWAEYVRVGGFVKDQMPIHMLRIFSLRHAARQFAPIGGNVVTEAEARFMQGQLPEEPPVDTGRVATQTLLATLNGKVGCESDEDRNACLRWILGDEDAAVDQLTGESAQDALNRLIQWTSADGFDRTWEEIMPLARGELVLTENNESA